MIMKQISQVKYGAQSRNAEHYQLFSGLLAAVTEEFATTYKLTPFRTAFATSFAKENEAYLQNQAYEGTKTVEKANETCDRRFRLFERNVEVGELSDEPAEVEAAERAVALEAVVDQMNTLILDYHKKLARRGIGSSSQTVSIDLETPDTEEPETPEEPDKERPGGL